MLNEKISAHNDWKRLSVGSSETKSVVALVEEGIRDGIEKLHVQAANGRLLYGFNPEETVASIIYQSIDLAIESGSSSPVMPEPVSMISQQDLSKVYDGYLGDTISHANQLRFLIRKGLMKLMQLARPEQIFLLKSFPQSYLREYMLAQEHFNLVIFLKTLIESAKTESEIKRFAKKWVIYTRSSGEIANLANKGADKVHLRRQVAELIGLDAADFHVISLSELTSTTQWTERLRELFTAVRAVETKPVMILCIASRESVNNDQINFFRGQVDEQRFPLNVTVVTLLHSPPEKVFTSHHHYPAVFLNGWDFMYFDSFGLVSRDSTPIESMERASVRGFSSLHNEIDGRSWIAWAFNLNDNVETVSMITAAFEKVFTQLIIEVRSSVHPYAPVLPRMDPKINKGNSTWPLIYPSCSLLY